MQDASPNNGHSFDIAVIGIAGRFPGASNPDNFWKNVLTGVTSITSLSDQDLERVGINRFVYGSPDYVKASPLLANPYDFDADFFNIPPAEAEYMDPQHRIFLECAVEALESAGYDSTRYDGSIGIYAGAGISSYLLSIVRHGSSDLRDSSVERTMVAVGNDKDYLATRVSYKLNLKGPSVTVQTACSTSLVAIHLACHSLLAGESDMALAGGVSVLNHVGGGYRCVEGGMFSPDGRCRPFDVHANGTVFGDGAGVVLLKTLDRARDDGDHIRAVIKGSAINNDGIEKAGYMAPSIGGQAQVIAEALSVAGVPADTLSYVEAHGTGTVVGDPIEFAALSKVFRAAGSRKQLCGLGSVKANIGHLNAAAGTAGLIKMVLALENEVLPPMASYERPNPEIDLANSPFVISTQAVQWPRGKIPRRAGVSSFGVGGTNAHLVVEEAPCVPPSASRKKWHLLALSARTPTALRNAAENLAAHLGAHPQTCIADVAFTLGAGRMVHSHGQAILCTGIDDASDALAGRSPQRVISGLAAAHPRPKIIFMFPGQGSQYVGMGRDLYEDEDSVFRHEIDRCADALDGLLETDLRDVLYPRSDTADRASDRINETAFAQPALFAVSYALARQWISFGVQPHAMIGHSIGEFVAACLSGVFSLEDALKIVAARAQLMQRCPRGSMLAIAARVSDAMPLLDDTLAVAAINGPGAFVVSGPSESVLELQQTLARRNVACSVLKTSHAYHSPLMAPAAAPLTDVVSQVRRISPSIPYVSNISGRWQTAEGATDSRYWANHLLSPVKFADGIALIAQEHPHVLLEVGPGRTLSALAQQNLDPATRTAVLTSLPHSNESGASSTESLLRALAHLWLQRAPVDWTQVYSGEARRRIPLPTYPFERRRFVAFGIGSPARPRGGELAESVDGAFHIPCWNRRALPAQARFQPDAVDAKWLVFANEDNLSAAFLKLLRARIRDVIVVTAGTRFRDIDDLTYQINAQNIEHFRLLFAALRAEFKVPRHIVYLWSATAEPLLAPGAAAPEEAFDPVFFCPMYLARAIGESGIADSVRISFVAAGTQEVIGDDMASALGAMVMGPSIVIPMEYPTIETQFIDLPSLPPDDEANEAIASRLVDELALATPDAIVAHRGRARWLRTFERVPLRPSSPSDTPTFRQGGVYLITGGLGELGLAVADYLACTVQAKLVLLGRKGLPERDQWDALSGDTAESRDIRIIRRIREMEKAGAEVMVASADVSCLDAMRDVAAQAYQRFGLVHGIVHAAGIAGVGPIGAKDKAAAMEVLAPKVAGLAVLEQIFHGKDIDFLVSFSSVNALHGHVGQIAYAAANAYLDAFARLGRSHCAKKVISINWDAWSEVGMAINTPLPPKLEELRRQWLRYGLLTSDGIEAFARVLAAAYPQVAVSMRDMNVVLTGDSRASRKRISSAEGLAAAADGNLSARGTHPRPNMRQQYVAPRTDLEKRVTAIWAELLQLDEVGVADDFFELGGHSLLGLQLLPRLRDEFGVDIAQRDLLSGPTVAQLSLVIEDGIVSQIQSMSDEDVRAAAAE